MSRSQRLGSLTDIMYTNIHDAENQNEIWQIKSDQEGNKLSNLCQIWLVFRLDKNRWNFSNSLIFKRQIS